MSSSIHLPINQLSTEITNYDLMADYVELATFFDRDSRMLISDLINQTSIGAESDYTSLDDEIQHGEDEIAYGTVVRLEARIRALECVYPFKLDSDGNVLRCVLSEGLGQVAYIISLILSNLKSLSPILSGSPLHPDKEDVLSLRRFFQYFATAALAAEIGGMAWSFGFPRPDGSGFLDKLEQIWQILGDGRVQSQIGAPHSPKDDKVDVFAARMHPDGLPGFLLAVAQVATGKDVSDKSLKGHLGAFKGRWFSRQPVTDFIPYMIVPFASSDDKLIDDVRTMGNMLHRLRMPRRVAEAEQLLGKKHVEIEGYDRLTEAARWVMDYRERARAVT